MQEKLYKRQKKKCLGKSIRQFYCNEKIILNSQSTYKLGVIKKKLKEATNAKVFTFEINGVAYVN